MKPSWKGSLSCGLVNINIELYSAIAPHIIGFKLLHAECLHPITYQRWCPHCKKEVPWSDIEKGIQLKDSTFFVMTPANLKKLKPARTTMIGITEFVHTKSIDPLLYHDHYYVIPATATYEQHAFFLFAQTMARYDMVAIGQFVLRDKEYVVAIRPYKNILLLTTLNYAYEIKKIPMADSLKIPKFNTKELTLAQTLIENLSNKTFDIKRYKDTFAVELIKKISKLKKGITIPTEKKRIEKPKEQSLLHTLQASIEQVKKQHTRRRTKKIS